MKMFTFTFTFAGTRNIYTFACRTFDQLPSFYRSRRRVPHTNSPRFTVSYLHSKSPTREDFPVPTTRVNEMFANFTLVFPSAVLQGNGQ